MQFNEYLANGIAAHAEKEFRVAKDFYHKAREAMEKLLSKYGASDELLEDYAVLLVKFSVVELVLGNIGEAKKAVEKSVDYNPTPEVCT